MVPTLTCVQLERNMKNLGVFPPFSHPSLPRHSRLYVLSDRPKSSVHYFGILTTSLFLRPKCSMIGPSVFRTRNYTFVSIIYESPTPCNVRTVSSLSLPENFIRWMKQESINPRFQRRVYPANDKILGRYFGS